jgi:cytochrome c-type biogenesis protein CcmH
MSERLRTIIPIVVVIAMAILLVTLVLTSPSDDDRLARLGGSIMCPVCQGESIAQSPAPMARDMMSLIEERIAAGASDAAILDEMLSSFTGAVLLDPPVSGPTIVLWLAPALALGIGVFVIWRWRRQVKAEVDAERSTFGRRPSTVVVMVAVMTGVVVIAGLILRDRDDQTLGGAASQVEDLDAVSNQTMEAVIAANPDNPSIDGMRLALAERYFTVGDYRSAFPHYLAVAESDVASDPQVVTALIGLGWMAWDGNGEADTAVGLFDQALAIDDESIPARFLKGRVLWCGVGEPAEAAELLDTLLQAEGLTAESRTAIEQDLAAIGRGEVCP